MGSGLRGLRTENCELRTEECGLETGDKGLGTGDWALGTGVFGMGTVDWGLWTGDCGLGTVDWVTVLTYGMGYNRPLGVLWRINIVNRGAVQVHGMEALG